MYELIAQQPLLAALIALVGLGTVFGALLGYAAERFKTEGNPIVDQINDIDPPVASHIVSGGVHRTGRRSDRGRYSKRHVGQIDHIHHPVARRVTGEDVESFLEVHSAAKPKATGT